MYKSLESSPLCDFLYSTLVVFHLQVICILETKKVRCTSYINLAKMCSLLVHKKKGAGSFCNKEKQRRSLSPSYHFYWIQ